MQAGAMPPVVVSGSASVLVAQRLAKELHATLAPTEVKRFPDGEGYVRLLRPEALRKAPVILVQSTAPDPNLVELLLWQDAAWEAGAASVTCVIPYMGYARQDRVFQPGEAISSRATSRALAVNADRILTIDPHKEETLAFFGGKAQSVSAVPALARQLKAWGVDTVLAPDKGARARAEQAAKLMGARVDHLEKTRLSATEVVMAAKELDVRGARVAIVDDLIASGGTMLTAAKQLKAQGARNVYAACTHGLFTGGAVPKLLAGGIDRILATDTVASDAPDVVSVAEVVANALRLEQAALS